MAFATSFQLLGCGIDIASDRAEVMAAVEFITPCAAQDFAVLRRHSYEVRLSDGRYEILEDGVAFDYERSPEYVMRRLYRRARQMALAVTPDSILLHAGLGARDDRRFMVVGPMFAGKTTLMIRLLYDGHRVEGDEMTLLLEGAATAFPRRFHLREASLAMLPQATAVAASMPCVVDELDRRLISFDPVGAGFDWRIGTGPVDTIFFLEQNHGGQTRVVDCPKVEMVHLVMTQSARPASRRSGWIGDLAATVDRARTFVVYNGDLDNTAREIARRLSA